MPNLDTDSSIPNAKPHTGASAGPGIEGPNIKLETGNPYPKDPRYKRG